MQKLHLTSGRAVALLGTVGMAVFAGVGYRALAQQAPTGAGASGSSRGQAVYDAHCVECHGQSGKGDGPASMTLMPHARDFTSGRYKIRSTETGSLPTDDDLLRSVRKGLYGSAMPGWEKLLPDDDIRAVVQYIKTFSPRFAAEQPEPIAASTVSELSPVSTTRGSITYDKLQCGKCHGGDGRGSGAAVTSFQDDWGFPMRATNLTEPWTFRGGPTTADVYMRFRAGISGTPMPSY